MKSSWRDPAVFCVIEKNYLDLNPAPRLKINLEIKLKGEEL